MDLQPKVEIIALMSTPLLALTVFPRFSHSLLGNFVVFVLSQYTVLLVPSLLPVFLALLLLGGSLRYFREEGEQMAGGNRREETVAGRTRCVGRNTGAQCNDSMSADKAASLIRLAFDIYRSMIMIAVTICIYMCDFSFWTPRLGKVDFYGVGLMDIGIGSFIFNAGLFSTRRNPHRVRKNILFLTMLGILRLVVVKACGLSVNPREYGLHMNFYFVLAAVDTLSYVFHSRYNFRIAAGLLAGHELLVWRLSGTILHDARHGLVMQNKEGLFSIAPSYAFFLLAGCAGAVLHGQQPVARKLRFITFCTVLSFAVHLLAASYSPVSRRLANLAFISWSMAVQFMFLGGCIVIAWLRAASLGSLPLARFVSGNMMVVFLFSNLLVLASKLVVSSGRCGLFSGNMLNMAYLALNFLALPVFYKKRLASGHAGKK